MNSFYFAIVTIMTVGYGDILPVTNTEKIFAICAILVGAFFYATFFGNVTLTIAIRERAKEEHNQKISDLTHFCEYYDIPENMKTHLVEQLESVFLVRCVVVLLSFIFLRLMIVTRTTH
jgi:hypothetical protein